MIEGSKDQPVRYWAVDVSTSWAHRSSPPVGITRTEIEFARRLYTRPNTLLTVYDQSRRTHVILSDTDARSLLQLKSDEPLVSNEPVRNCFSISTAVVAMWNGVRSAWCCTLVVISALLLLIVPSRLSAYRKLKLGALKVLAKHGATLPSRLRSRLERAMGAHPSRPKYLGDYQSFKELALVRKRMSDLDFSTVEKYISVGCSWDMNDLEAIYRHKKRWAFTVVTCIYDLVPIVMPDVVPLSVTNLFLPYLCALLWVSDVAVCISKATKSDVEAFVTTMGAPHPRLTVCNLGFVPSYVQPTRPRIADALHGRPFALYVSTFEPRKNHVFIYYLWTELVRRKNVEPIPLVLAGRVGWRTENLLDRIRINKHLYPEYLVLGSGLSDSELAWLYRECRFTVYPSLYEGWGLPVSESLSFGKFCIASDNSSLPEAGQDLVRHISLLDGRQWLDEVERCIGDDAYLRKREERIKQDFSHRDWKCAADDFFAIVQDAVVEEAKS